MVEFAITYPFSKESAAELREPILSVVMDLIKSVQESEDGYILNFGRVPEAINPLAQLIQVEKIISPFIRMALTVESNDGPVKLDMSGPTGTKDFLYTEYGLKRWILT